MDTLLRRILPSPGLYLTGASVLVIASLLVAYGLMWWTRGIAVPVLFLIGLWYWALRASGSLGPRELVGVKVWAIVLGFFLIGPLAIDLFRIALLALLLLVAFKPGGST